MKAQLSIEFIAAVMFYLFVVILVFVSILRSNNLLSDSILGEMASLSAARISLMMTGSHSGFLQGQYLSKSKIDAFPKSYVKQRERLGVKEGEFYARLSYAPSIVIDVFFENPMARGPTQHSFAFDSFNVSFPVNLTVRTYLDDKQTDIPVYVLLVNSSDSLVLWKQGTGHFSFKVPRTGIYTFKFIAADPSSHRYGYREETVGVLT